MLKKSATLLLVSTMLTAGAAMAQTGSGSSTGSSSTSSAQAGGKFITEQSQNEFRASKLVGLNVYGTDNQKIGDINEVLLDRSGNAHAVVIGVGGFLGIGEKNVAVPFSSLEWANARPSDNRTASTASGTSASGTSDANRSTSAASNTADANRSTASTMGTAGDATRSAATSATNAAGTSGSTGRDASTTASTNNRSSADTAASQGYPDHAVLRMTKDDLQNAPTFRYFADAGSRSGSGNAGSSAGGTASGNR